MRLKLCCRTALPIVGALALAGFHPSSRAQTPGSWVTMDVIYDPVVAASAARAQNQQVPQAQEPDEWDGLAPVPDPAEKTGQYDFHQFVVEGVFDNDSMQVKITWDPGPALAYDIDLYVERFVDGVWTPFGQSTNSQSLGDGVAAETYTATSPPPGQYRTRVHNWASHQIAYHGAITYTSDGIITKKKKPRVSGGRATADRPDMTAMSQIHTIYFVPSDANDESLDINGTLEDALASINQWFQFQTDRRMRIDTYSDKTAIHPDISFVRGLKTTAEYSAGGTFAAVTSELAERGWNADPTNKRYLVYYEGPAQSPNICGTAFFTLGSGFAQWSVVFLGAAPGCGARDFGSLETGGGGSESIAVQEMLHNEGQTRPEAPHHCGANQGHICTAQAGSQLNRVQQGLDPESPDALFPFVNFPLRRKVLDIGRNDYYQHPFSNLYRDLAFSPYWEN